jgi:hypothetical protein
MYTDSDPERIVSSIQMSSSAGDNVSATCAEAAGPASARRWQSSRRHRARYGRILSVSFRVRSWLVAPCSSVTAGRRQWIAFAIHPARSAARLLDEPASNLLRSSPWLRSFVLILSRSLRPLRLNQLPP